MPFNIHTHTVSNQGDFARCLYVMDKEINLSLQQVHHSSYFKKHLKCISDILKVGWDRIGAYFILTYRNWLNERKRKIH